MQRAAETYRIFSAQQRQPMVLDVAFDKQIAVHLLDIICSRGHAHASQHPSAQLPANLLETPLNPVVLTSFSSINL